MTPLYTQEEFQNANSRTPLPLKCLNCNLVFYRSKNLIQKTFLINRNEKYNFCSNKCQNNHQSPPILVKCTQCNNLIRKAPKEIKNSKNHFCNHSCSAKYSNAHKTKGTRISKLEKWLQIQLPLKYPNFEFQFNKTNAINAELDVYIPSLNLAFELNGIFHYEPIFGKEKLDKLQNNDNRKIQACIENNIELCIIDVSTQKYFKEQTSLKYLDIISNIINLKLSNNSSNI